MYEDDPDITEEERRLINLATSSRSNAAGIGGSIGTVAGAGLGALTGLFTAGASTLPAATLGAGLGSAAGSAIGNWIGGGISDDAEKRAAALKEARMKELEKQNKGSVVGELLNPWLKTPGIY